LRCYLAWDELFLSLALVRVEREPLLLLLVQLPRERLKLPLLLNILLDCRGGSLDRVSIDDLVLEEHEAVDKR
jgi:hypothetical protein